MDTPNLSIIVAMTPKRVIGKDGALPWEKLRSDLRNFRFLTTGCALIMGEKTFSSIITKRAGPLPGRASIVLTRHHTGDVLRQGGIAISSPEQALVAAHGHRGPKIFVIGGASVYERFLPHAKTLYITTVHADIEGDTHFPEVNFKKWRRTDFNTQCRRDPEDEHDTSYEVWELRS